MIDHQPGDLVCTVSADVTLAELQAALAGRGQMLALDPPGAAATPIGDVFDRGLFGPRAHRYGLPRDLVLGIRAELVDGTVVRSGGRVVKNVAGYDLSKLFTGARGRLGRLLELTVRLHPLPPTTATLVCEPCDPAPLLRLAPA
ncbi:MAG TPA: FAD-binding protein, partial [Gaiellales bacterium]|nr:FAD-binding protein [Gaiellales bacterium]